MMPSFQRSVAVLQCCSVNAALGCGGRVSCCVAMSVLEWQLVSVSVSVLASVWQSVLVMECRNVGVAWRQWSGSPIGTVGGCCGVGVFQYLLQTTMQPPLFVSISV